MYVFCFLSVHSEFHRAGKSRSKIVSNTATSHIEHLDIKYLFADIDVRTSLGREVVLFLF